MFGHMNTGKICSYSVVIGTHIFSTMMSKVCHWMYSSLKEGNLFPEDTF
jgi:hypothetical protein